MLQEYKNSKKQGDAGLGIAIGYFTTIGHGVLIPLTDSQDYDLVIDDGSLKKVQVRTTTDLTKHGKYRVQLSVKGGNKSRNTVKVFDPKLVDLLFVVTGAGARYLIPSQTIAAKHQLTLDGRFDSCRVH